MKKLYLIILAAFTGGSVYTQQVDSIFFHLYTDSLKKGTYNYVNIDGKTSEGRWMPLTDLQVDFKCSAGKFEGNSLVLDKNFSEDSVVVTAMLKTDSRIRKSVTIYVKKLEDSGKLKTKEEIMREIETQMRGRQ